MDRNRLKQSVVIASNTRHTLDSQGLHGLPTCQSTAGHGGESKLMPHSILHYVHHYMQCSCVVVETGRSSHSNKRGSTAEDPRSCWYGDARQVVHHTGIHSEFTQCDALLAWAHCNKRGSSAEDPRLLV